MGLVRMVGHRSPVSCCSRPRYILRYPDTWHFIATDMMIGSREMPTQEAIMRTWCKTLAEPHMVSINHIWSIFPGWQGPDCEFDMSRWLSRDDEFFLASQTHKHSQCEITEIFPRQWEYFMTVRAPPHLHIIQNQNIYFQQIKQSCSWLECSRERVLKGNKSLNDPPYPSRLSVGPGGQQD